MATVSLQTAFDEARRAIETGAADKAIGIAQHILTHFPRMIEGSRLLGEAYLNAGQPEQAAAAFSQVLAADPENVAAYYGRGLAQQSLDQRAAAITSFERALEIQPNLADLRTQLMRLYAETPGSAGQFRLSRAGLGRLYARGGMFSQAVDEFRAVLDAEPDRDDAQVALAEALWRDGQEDEAMEYCRDVLEQQPDLIKPTVLLAYMQVAGGQPEGEALWRRAAEQDATMALARTLFDILPPIRIEEPVLPEFDEAEWRAQTARRAAQTQAAPVAPAASEAEDDIFADSWLSTAGTAAAAAGGAHIAQSYETPAAQAVGGSDDDLLASLLGFADDEPAAPVAESETAELDAGVQPFSFDDWDTPTNAAAPSPALPASLDDLALDDEPAAEQPNAGLGNVQPFSLDDWNLDEDAPAAPSAQAQPEPFSFDDQSDDQPGAEPAVEPFSLNADSGDMGGVQPFSLDDDLDVAPFSFEDDATPAASAAPTARSGDAGDPESGLGAVQPFSLDDWGLDSADAAGDELPAFGTQSQAAAGDDLGDLKPFSLDELSLDALDSGAPSALSGPPMAEPEESAPEPSGFNWQAPSWRSQMNPQPQQTEAQDDESIFAKLLRNRPGDAGSADAQPPQTELESDDRFFSLDDEPLRLDIDEIDSSASTADFADPVAEAPATSFSSEAPAAPQPEEPVAPFALDDLATSDAAFSWETPDTAQPEAPVVPFALDDLATSDAAFSWETPETAQPEAPAATPAQSDDDMVPFSLADLGLTDEELSALDEQPELAADTTDEAETTPFSLADLGLTDDEIAALDLGDEQPADSAAPSFTDATAADTGDDATADMAPFSLADLGLTDDELDLLSSGEADTTSAAADTTSTDDELADLLASLDQPAAAEEELSDEAAELAPFMPALDEEAPSIAAEPVGDAAAAQSDETAADPFAAWDLGSDATFDDAAASPSAETDAGEEWLDLRSQLDVDAPATRTPDDFLSEAQETDGDVQSVLETMPDEPAAEALPFSLADLGLDDDETTLFAAESDVDATGTAETPFTFEQSSDAGETVSEAEVAPAFEAEPVEPADAVAYAEASADADAGDEVDLSTFGSAADAPTTEEAEPVDVAAFAPGLGEDEEAQPTDDASFGQPAAEPADTASAEVGEPFAALGQPAFEESESVAATAAPTYGEAEPAVEVAEAAPDGGPAADAVPAAEPTPAAPAVAAAAAVPAAAAVARPGGDDRMSAFRAQLAANPDNDALRLAIARMSQGMNDLGGAVEQYKALIKRGTLMDDVVEDIQDSIADNDDPHVLRRLHRLLGDAYMKQNRLTEAMDEYSWTSTRSA